MMFSPRFATYSYRMYFGSGWLNSASYAIRAAGIIGAPDEWQPFISIRACWSVR